MRLVRIFFATLPAIAFAIAPLQAVMARPSAIASAAATPAKLEGMRYPKARRIILGMGWRPVTGGCDVKWVSAGDICKRYPEIDACTNDGSGFCAMLFARDRRCLIITTHGGAGAVEGVSFKAAPKSTPCVKTGLGD